MGFFTRNNKAVAPVKPAASQTEKKKIQIYACDMRDGQQSLYATRFRIEDMVPIMGKMDQLGLESVECWGGAVPDVCVRYLNEDPWERLRTIRKHMPNTKLMCLIRGSNLVGYRQYPDDITERFITRAAENGMDIFQVFDGLNDIRNCEPAIRAAKKMGKEVVGIILFTISPVHNVESYVRTALEQEALGVDAISLGDMAGQMTPTMAATLVRAIKEAIHIPLRLHFHTGGGMADLGYWEGIKAGADVIGTDFASMAYGTALPAIESFAAALSDTPYATDFDFEKLAEVNDYFCEMTKKYEEFHTNFSGVNIRVLKNQIPGGMLSNMEFQLKSMNILDRLPEVLEEVPRVRADMGYPPLATPFSQMVGAQAMINVVTGSRYKMISKEIRNYVKGLYGRVPGPLNPDLMKIVLGDEKPNTVRPASLLPYEYEKIAAECRDFARTEEDVLTYALFQEYGKSFLKRKYGLE